MDSGTHSTSKRGVGSLRAGRQGAERAPSAACPKGHGRPQNTWGVKAWGAGGSRVSALALGRRALQALGFRAGFKALGLTVLCFRVSVRCSAPAWPACTGTLSFEIWALYRFIVLFNEFTGLSGA